MRESLDSIQEEAATKLQAWMRRELVLRKMKEKEALVTKLKRAPSRRSSRAKKVRNQRWESGMLKTGRRKEALAHEIIATKVKSTEDFCSGTLGACVMDRLLKRAMKLDDVLCDAAQLEALYRITEPCTEFDLR